MRQLKNQLKRADSARRQQIKDLAIFWREEVYRLYYENHLHLKLPDLFPEIESVEGILSRRTFLKADRERRLLIGSLEWFGTPEAPFFQPLNVDKQTKLSALFKFQNVIGDACIQEDTRWRIIIDPRFAEMDEFNWLAYKKPQPPPFPKTDVRPQRWLAAQTNFPLTRPCYPLDRWPGDKPFIRHNGVRYFQAEAQTQVDDGNNKEMPHGVVPMHILDVLVSIYRQTGSRLIAWRSIEEMVESFGYSKNQRNLNLIRNTLRAMFYTRLLEVDQNSNHHMDITPFQRLGIDTCKSGPKARNSREFATFVLLNPLFVRFYDNHAKYPLDWSLLNQFKASPKLWLFYRKAVELGIRGYGTVPLGGDSGLLNELGFNTSSPKHYRNSKYRLKKIIDELTTATSKHYGAAKKCPHKISKGGEVLRFFPWEPLETMRLDFPVPPTTRVIADLNQCVEAILGQQTRDRTVEVIL